jgi:hypothetical protein
MVYFDIIIYNMVAISIFVYQIATVLFINAKKMTVYKVRTTKETNRFGKVFYYPIVSFYCKATGEQYYYLNVPQTSRSKARTVAKNHIKNIQS